MCWSRHHRLLLSNCFPQTWIGRCEDTRVRIGRVPSTWSCALCSDKLNIIFWWGLFDWTPHKWGKVCSFPSSREPRHLTDAVSSYIQTWTYDHSDWKEIMFLIIFRTPQYINCNINDKNTCIYRVFQTNAVVPHASSSEWVFDWEYAQRWIVLTWIFWLKLFPQWRQLNL